MSSPRVGPSGLKTLDQVRDLYRVPVHSHYRKQLARLGISPDASVRQKLEAFLPRNIWAWIRSYLKYAFNRKHRFNRYEGAGGDRGICPLTAVTGNPAGESAAIRVSMTGDWASGTEEAYRVAEQMVGDQLPHYTIHLGDVYYVGDREGVEENCLGTGAGGVTWPRGAIGSFALNGNHEMYANGNGYFDLFLPKLGMRGASGDYQGQSASYFCLQNQWWSVIGLDTGYNSIGLPILSRIPLINRINGVGGTCHLESAQMDWLRHEVAPNLGSHGVILLSHHQYYSAFEDGHDRPAKQLKEFFARPVLWYWGHEHRMAIYDKVEVAGGIAAYGRCVGNGGMPVDRKAKVKRPNVPLLMWDHRFYRRYGEDEVAPNGYADFLFDRDRLTVEHRDLDGTLLARERWQAGGGDLTLLELSKVCDGLSSAS